MNVVIDTSILIDYLKGAACPTLEEHLEQGHAWITPLVCAELISGARNSSDEKKLISFLEDLPVTTSDLDHWFRVGRLRNLLRKRGLSVSTPDAHIAQSALDLQATLLTRDGIFRKISPVLGMKILGQ